MINLKTAKALGIDDPAIAAAARGRGDSVMDRRTFLASVAGGALALPLGARAQPQGKVWRVGFLYFGSRQSALDTGRYRAFVQGLRELGYVEGKNVTVEARFGDGQIERMSGLAGELVRSKVDVIVATGTVAYRALQHATTTIPIVITVTNDPVILGLAASFVATRWKLHRFGRHCRGSWAKADRTAHGRSA